MDQQEQAARAAVVAEARKWLGTPFIHDAEVVNAGVDCAHLVNAILRATGHLPSITFPTYGPDWFRHATDPEKNIVETLKQYAPEISEAEAGPGDVVVIWFGRAWAHCAILSGKDRAIEAWITRGHVAEVNTKEERLYRTHQKRYFSPFKK